MTSFDSCDVIKMRKMRGEVEKKPKKRWRIAHFYYVTGIKSGTDWASSVHPVGGEGMFKGGGKGKEYSEFSPMRV